MLCCFYMRATGIMKGEKESLRLLSVAQSAYQIKHLMEFCANQ